MAAASEPFLADQSLSAGEAVSCQAAAVVGRFLAAVAFLAAAAAA